MTVPRPEHPRPQFVRDRWASLNGEWEFEIDRGDSGLERGLVRRPLSGRILVPFAPESTASGIGDVDFMAAVWYRRDVTVPAGWDGNRILLHFGAVDHDATVWVDGHEVGRHRGGFTPFTIDVTDALTPGQAATLVVRARDTRDAPQARGKQSILFANSTCNYTRTTGIWQTVWLEAVPTQHLRRPRVTPDVAGSAFVVVLPLSQNRAGSTVTVRASTDGVIIAEATTRADLDLAPSVRLTVPSERVRLWSPRDPHLYDLEFEIRDARGELVDRATGYAGLRSVAIDGRAILINGEHVFQRLVLDQGWWPDTLMTAPSDAALVRDIELSLQAGFNGARLHQKVFEERFLYHADRLGYLLWGEFGDWGVSGQGIDGDNQHPTPSFVAQWLEVLERDHNHPSIIGWCPLNETHQILHDRITVLDDVTRAMFLATKLADPSRPVVDASGYSHRVAETDVWDSHSYEQDPAAFAVEQSGLADGRPYGNRREKGPMSLPYAGQPYFVSEFGGIWWAPQRPEHDGQDRRESWGYGQRVESIDEFYSRFEGLVRVLAGNADMFGYCYTQLTDVFQEENGIFGFDRSVKFDLAKLRAIQQVATYEALDRADAPLAD